MSSLSVPVTVVIPTLNEQDRIVACLASVSWADEVIVADGGSTDETVAAAIAAGARVLTGCGPTIADQRNAAIAAASHDWVLALDADERATPALLAAIAAMIAAPTHEAYAIRMQNQYLGAPMTRGGWGRDWHVRLFRAELRYEVKRVHEGLAFAGEAGELQGTIEHDSYRDLYHHLSKVTTYSRWGADDLRQRGRTAGMSHLVGRPLWRFIKAYLVDGNWRDGRRGFVFSVIHAWSAFAKYALLWDHERQAQQGRDQAALAAVPTPARRVHAPRHADALVATES